MNQKKLSRSDLPDRSDGVIGSTGAPGPNVDAEGKLARARGALLPEFNTAAVVQKFPGPSLGEQDYVSLLDVTIEMTQAMLSGDMRGAEAMLFGQAQALQAVFVNLLRRAAAQDDVGHSEPYFRVALKAQNQCRVTLETLATIKNPPTIFAKQANINNGGQQQVNNAVPPPSSRRNQERTRARAKNSETWPNELLESNDGNRMDGGATGAPGRGNQAVAPLGKVDRSDKRRG